MINVGWALGWESVLFPNIGGRRNINKVSQGCCWSNIVLIWEMFHFQDHFQNYQNIIVGTGNREKIEETLKFSPTSFILNSNLKKKLGKIFELQIKVL